MRNKIKRINRNNDSIILHILAPVCLRGKVRGGGAEGGVVWEQRAGLNEVYRYS